MILRESAIGPSMLCVRFDVTDRALGLLELTAKKKPTFLLVCCVTWISYIISSALIIINDVRLNTSRMYVYQKNVSTTPLRGYFHNLLQ